MKTDKIKGLSIWTETTGTNVYLKAQTIEGETIVFPHPIKPVREVFNKVIEILSTVSWEGVTVSNITKEHYEVYKKARYETSKI